MSHEKRNAATSSRRFTLFGFGKPYHDYGFPPEAFDPARLPDVDVDFLEPKDAEAFAQALSAPDPINSSPDDGSVLRSPVLRSPTLRSPSMRSSSIISLEQPQSPVLGSTTPLANSARARHGSQGNLLISAQNDWAPVNEKIHRPGRRRKKRRAALGRSVDEAREGYLYALLRWPFLFVTLAWISGLGAAYLLTRLYVWGYEYYVAWRGRRETLRRNMRATSTYQDWTRAAKELDQYLGNHRWREENEYAYYDSKTVRRVWEQIRKLRHEAEALEAKQGASPGGGHNVTDAQGRKPVEELKTMIESCAKSNFVGVENARLYSETYYGTKNLVQNFVDEGRCS